MFFASSFDIISVVRCAKSKEWVPEPKIFSCIPASAAHAAAVNHNGINTLLVMV